VPPAVFDLRPLSYMDFADQFVDLFEFSLPLSDQTKDCAIDWAFSGGSHAHGPLVLWPVIRGSPLSVTLTISGNRGSSSGTRLVYPDTLPRGASVNNPDARREYAQALLNRLLGAQPGSIPTSTWPPAFWEMLPQIVQGGEAKDLLAFLFQHCPADLASHLSLEDRTRLGGIYYDELKEDKTTALAVLKSVAAAEKDPAAQFQWQLKAIDFLLFEAGDIPAARRAAQSLRIDPFHGGSHDAELQLIALGDVERMAGNIGPATQYYTNAQALYKKTARPPVAGFTGFTGFADPTNNPTPRPKDGIVITAADTQDADWRKRAVLQNSYYTQVKNLLDQDELGDAREKLDAWEIEFPLSKLEGDYVLAEAEYAIKFADFNRAQHILKAYRLRVDLSAQLAEVMQLEWNCAAQLQRPDDIKELAADIKKRFPDLPLATEAGKALHGEMPQTNSP
jgi:hypothetical protein